MTVKTGIINSKDDERYTPKKVVDFFGPFDYDPATIVERAALFGIENFDTKETNGLTTDWTKYKRIWINPPFTMKNAFVEKAFDSYRKCENDIYILIPNDYLYTKGFFKLVEKYNMKYKIFIPKRRIKFEKNGNDAWNNPNFACAIIHPCEANTFEHIDIDNGTKLC